MIGANDDNNSKDNTITGNRVVPHLLFTNKRVVELGCGLGLCGLVVAVKFCGADSVLLSDREPVALHCAFSTAPVNNLSNDILQATLLDWTSMWEESNSRNDTTAKKSTTVPPTADVVLASDVLYDAVATIVAFAQACRRICRTGGVLLVADPRAERIEGARDLFRHALEQRQEQQQ